MRTNPCGSASSASAARATSPAHSAMFFAGASSRSPALVSVAPPTPRANNREPMDCSISVRRRLIVG